MYSLSMITVRNAYTTLIIIVGCAFCLELGCIGSNLLLFLGSHSFLSHFSLCSRGLLLSLGSCSFLSHFSPCTCSRGLLSFLSFISLSSIVVFSCIRSPALSCGMSFFFCFLVQDCCSRRVYAVSYDLEHVFSRDIFGAQSVGSFLFTSVNHYLYLVRALVQHFRSPRSPRMWLRASSAGAMTVVNPPVDV
jgi:hypothetical protein